MTPKVRYDFIAMARGTSDNSVADLVIHSTGASAIAGAGARFSFAARFGRAGAPFCPY